MEINMNIFDEFNTYISNNGYELDTINETSIRGIKNDIIVHLFFDFMKYDEYVLTITKNNYREWNTIFISKEDGYELNHKHKEQKYFKNLQQIIDYTNSNIDFKI